jgi:hypothetical protein
MITATFTDPQGTLQTDAVLYVRAGRTTVSTEERYNLNSSNFVDVTNEAPHVYKNVGCSFYYWVNAAAKTAGAAPYILANPDEMDMDFAFTPDETYDGLTLEAKCEKHLLDVILPPMQA